ncbi:multicopper oxidase family protein [Nocardioides sp.]|uniref:multicopper oxidase family protein n=1 Tax=Nocardioides sp. TaxID=35761 RepID=UPI00352751E0
MFAYDAPNALAPDFRFKPVVKPGFDRYDVRLRKVRANTGLVNRNHRRVTTPVYAYGDADGYSWPGRTFVAHRDRQVRAAFRNQLPLGKEHLLPVDTSGHWAYSLHGYRNRTIVDDGVPIVTHLHGGHTRSDWDGFPEYFYTRGYGVTGPGFPGRVHIFDNDQEGGFLWYHDHVLGITRLNVYAGLAGMYFLRDDVDTGGRSNARGLPYGPHELAYVIQDRMFRNNGSLFYPAFPGDPAWADFITDEGLNDEEVPQPSALAEFFGDIVTVNGVVWPRAEVEARHYRVRLLNGCDSRFLAMQLRVVPEGATSLDGASEPLPFSIIGSDQGLGRVEQVDHVLMGPGERLDLVLDFRGLKGKRVILANTAADAPFGGDLDGDPDDFFPDRRTDRLLAFDVVQPFRVGIPDSFDPSDPGHYAGVAGPVAKVRRLALYEGTDEYGRLQPMLGTAEPTMDASGAMVDGALPWHMPITENPLIDTTEVWEIYNNTMDAHPVHLHQVSFEVLDRRAFTADLVDQPVMQHDGAMGHGARMSGTVVDPTPLAASGHYTASPKDMVTALPGQVTRIKMHWDVPGRYVWHCHILSHEDHDMMRPLEVVTS